MIKTTKRDVEVRHLRKLNAELVEALKQAIQCVEWCRARHSDPQSGTGFPIEILWKQLLMNVPK